MIEQKQTMLSISLNDKITYELTNCLGKIVVSDYRVLIGRSRYPHAPLESFRDLSNTTNLKMELKIGEKSIFIELPGDMMRRLGEYLSDRSYPFINKDFDCVSFVHWMLDEPYTFRSGIDLNKFSMEKIDNLSLLKPGDIVHLALGNIFSNRSAKHAAIYIGNGLFISKLGKWKLSVQDINQIESDYGKSSLFKQIKKNTSDPAGISLIEKIKRSLSSLANI